MPALLALIGAFIGFWLGYAVGKSTSRNINLSMNGDGLLSVTDDGRSIKVNTPKGKATIVSMDDPLDIDLGDGSVNEKPKTN